MTHAPSGRACAALALPLALAPLALAAPLLFRRGTKPTREDAFQDLFDSLSNVYAQVAGLKDGWQADWRARAEAPLPPKYDFDNASASAAAADMRFGVALLQRNRWKSLVEPLFAELDPTRWERFVAGVRPTAAMLLDIEERRAELLQADERDWVEAAIEQFDEAARRINRADQPAHQRVAETAYGYVYVAIQLSDRLIERLRFEAAQKR